MSLLDPIEFFFDENAQFQVGGIPLPEILEENNTPFYIYDAEKILNQYEKTSSCFQQFEIFYSLKANPNLSICSLLRSKGARAEVASVGELHIALKSGFDPKQILFVGPGKSKGDLRAAIRNDIRWIVAESATEITTIEAICDELNTEMDILIRVNSERRAESTVAETMSGGPSKFGIDQAKFVKKVKNLPFQRTNLIGIHSYTASQVLDEESLLDNARHILDFAIRASQELGFELKVVDFGGGFGVPYKKVDKSLDIDHLAEAWKGLLSTRDLMSKQENPIVLPILELGRYLTAQSGVYVTQVLYVKESQGKKFVITDGGINHQGRPMLMGGIQHPLTILNRHREEPSEEVTLAGPLCTQQDTFFTTKLPKVEEGDFVGIFNSGAYGMSYSLLNFLSHPWPAELLVKDGELLQIRESMGLEDLLKNQKDHGI